MTTQNDGSTRIPNIQSMINSDDSKKSNFCLNGTNNQRISYCAQKNAQIYDKTSIGRDQIDTKGQMYPRYSSYPLSPLSTFTIPNFDSDLSASSLAHGLSEIITTKIDEAGFGDDAISSIDNLLAIDTQPTNVATQVTSNNLGSMQSYSDLLEFLQGGDYYKSQSDDSSIKNTPNIDDNVPGVNDAFMRQKFLPSFISHPPSVESFEFCGDHKRYLESFCNDFSRVITPLTAAPDKNPVRDIILTYAKNNNYLLAVVLSCGALQLHRKTHIEKDKAAYGLYLWICIKLLSTVLSDEKKIREKIEPMILTLLLLASYTAVSNIQKWRPHLKAAKELLAAYAPRKDSTGYSESSYVLAFCRTWYTSIEVIAGLTASKGGTIDSETEIDSLIFDLPDMRYYLQVMNISRKDDFNLFYGYTNSLAVSLQKLAKYMQRIRKYKKSIKTHVTSSPNITVEELQSLMHNIWKNQNFFIISKNGIIPKDHFILPENYTRAPPGFEPLSYEAIEKLELVDGRTEYISWYDICQQSYAWTALLLVFTRIQELPPKHYLVKQTVHKILSLMIFLHAKKTVTGYVMMLLQCSVYITGLNCTDICDRQLVLKFFDNLNVMGNISAKVNKAKLIRVWKKYDSNGGKTTVVCGSDSDDDDNEIPKDIISY